MIPKKYYQLIGHRSIQANQINLHDFYHRFLSFRYFCKIQRHTNQSNQFESSEIYSNQIDDLNRNF